MTAIIGSRVVAVRPTLRQLDALFDEVLITARSMSSRRVYLSIMRIHQEESFDLREQLQRGVDHLGGSGWSGRPCRPEELAVEHAVHVAVIERPSSLLVPGAFITLLSSRSVVA